MERVQPLSDDVIQQSDRGCRASRHKTTEEQLEGERGKGRALNSWGFEEKHVRYPAEHEIELEKLFGSSRAYR